MNAARSLILFVDDQEVARRYFSLMFAGEYDIITADNAEDAWMLIQEHADRLAVVITDQRMGHHTGVDLLMAVRQKHPRLVRLLTTGYGDLEEAIDAVHRGDLHAYIQKPWNIEEFGLDIRRAVALYDLQRERDSLLDVQARALRHAFAADRLRAYGLIAATCSAWIDHAVTATLAFWGDCLRHDLVAATPHDQDTESTDDDPWPSAAQLKAASVDHTRAMMAEATTAGAWLHAMRSSEAEPTEVVQVVKAVADEAQIPIRGDDVALQMPVHVAFLAAGLHALITFFRTSAAHHGDDAIPVIDLGLSQDGGLDITLRLLFGGTPPTDVVTPAVTVEALGWKGYVAIHHHGGSITIREWGTVRGLIAVHLPLRIALPSRQPHHEDFEATNALVNAITQSPKPEERHVR